MLLRQQPAVVFTPRRKRQLQPLLFAPRQQQTRQQTNSFFFQPMVYIVLKPLHVLVNMSYDLFFFRGRGIGAHGCYHRRDEDLDKVAASLGMFLAQREQSLKRGECRQNRSQPKQVLNSVQRVTVPEEHIITNHPQQESVSHCALIVHTQLGRYRYTGICHGTSALPTHTHFPRTPILPMVHTTSTTKTGVKQPSMYIQKK